MLTRVVDMIKVLYIHLQKSYNKVVFVQLLYVTLNPEMIVLPLWICLGIFVKIN